jgi:hypothetical protein
LGREILMNRCILFLVLLLACAQADARTLTATLEYRVKSHVSDVTSFGNLTDNLDYSWPVEMTSPTQIYRADRAVGTASADVLGLVGSLTNAIGETVSFATVQGLFLQEVSGIGTLTVSGLATATIPPYGTLALTGAMTVASISDQLSISSTATTTYRVWIVGQ